MNTTKRNEEFCHINTATRATTDLWEQEWSLRHHQRYPPLHPPQQQALIKKQIHRH